MYNYKKYKDILDIFTYFKDKWKFSFKKSVLTTITIRMPNDLIVNSKKNHAIATSCAIKANKDKVSNEIIVE